MSRLFVLVFALLLPFQFAWAGAAAYCQHEGEPEGQSTSVSHFGHHSHVHKDAGGAKQGAASKLVADSDCGVCHAAGASLTGAAAGLPAAGPTPAPWLAATADPPASAPARAPDRPQWLRLA